MQTAESEPGATPQQLSRSNLVTLGPESSPSRDESLSKSAKRVRFNERTGTNVLAEPKHIGKARNKILDLRQKLRVVSHEAATGTTRTADAPPLSPSSSAKDIPKDQQRRAVTQKGIILDDIKRAKKSVAHLNEEIKLREQSHARRRERLLHELGSLVARIRRYMREDETLAGLVDPHTFSLERMAEVHAWNEAFPPSAPSPAGAGSLHSEDLASPEKAKQPVAPSAMRALTYEEAAQSLAVDIKRLTVSTPEEIEQLSQTLRSRVNDLVSHRNRLMKDASRGINIHFEGKKRDLEEQLKYERSKPPDRDVAEWKKQYEDSLCECAFLREEFRSLEMQREALEDEIGIVEEKRQKLLDDIGKETERVREEMRAAMGRTAREILSKGKKAGNSSAHATPRGAAEPPDGADSPQKVDPEKTHEAAGSGSPPAAEANKLPNPASRVTSNPKEANMNSLRAQSRRLHTAIQTERKSLNFAQAQIAALTTPRLTRLHTVLKEVISDVKELERAFPEDTMDATSANSRLTRIAGRAFRTTEEGVQFLRERESLLVAIIESYCTVQHASLDSAGHSSTSSARTQGVVMTDWQIQEVMKLSRRELNLHVKSPPPL